MFENKLRKVLLDKKIKLSQYAAMAGKEQSNFSHQLKRDNFSENDMKHMAELLDCDLEIIIRDRKTGNEY